MTQPKEVFAYGLEPEDIAKLRQVSARLNSPRHLPFDNRRDLANLVDLICSRAVPIDDPNQEMKCVNTQGGSTS